MSLFGKKYVKIGLSVIISVLFLIYVYVNRHAILSTLVNIKWQFLLIVFAGEILIQLSNAGLLKATLKPLDKNIGSVEAFRLTLVSSFVNFFTPVVGGVGLRAVYLKRKKELSYSNFIGLIYGNYLIIFLVSFLFGFVGVVTIKGALHSDVGKIVATFFGVGAALSLVFMAIGHIIIDLLQKLPVKSGLARKTLEKLSLIDEGWSKIRKDSKTLIKMITWSTTAILSVMLVYWSATHSINLTVPINMIAIYAALSTVGLLINITPGSIGIRETVYAAIYSITAINAQQVVSFSLIDRTAQLVILGLGWMVFSRTILDGLERDIS